MAIPENLLFINAAPHDKYFQWQEEVFITNARKHGFSDKVQVIVWYPTGSTELKNWEDLQRKYPEVGFFFYEDEGVNLSLYIPQLRPHSLKKHFKTYGEDFKDKVFFYHDSDIIFNKLPDFEKLVQGDICWQSDTSSYLDYTYIVSKEDQGKIPDNEALKLFAEIGDITTDVIKSYDRKTGGAQYILKGIDSEFWEDVERMCIDIRNKFFFNIPDSINKKYFTSENQGFQSWCADMWAVNFSLWKRGIKTDITDELDFSWATDDVATYDRKPIFHNAGVTSAKELFYKGNYINKSPIGQALKMPPENSASRKYVEAIMEVK